MATRRARRATLVGCATAAVVIAGGVAVATRPSLPTGPSDLVEAARIRTTPPSLALRGAYPREDRFVRDLYARLMRYDFAAREFHRIESGRATTPSAYLVVALRDIRTRPWTGRIDAGALAAGPGMLAIQRRALCDNDDPCHAYYEVAWGRAGPEAAAQRQPPSFGDVTRYTTYTVALTLGGISRTYDAIVLYHDDHDGLTATPEVLDPLIPDLDALAGDRAPLARAPWNDYRKTRRYAAVVQQARNWLAGPRPRAFNGPIGYLMGDDVTPQSEQAMVMSGEPCGGGVTVSQSPGRLPLSTGDTGAISVTVSPAESITRTFTSSRTSNPRSNCDANLNIPAVTAAGTANSSVTASPAGCSGVFTARASAGGVESSNATTVEVPPQILVRMLYGEARDLNDQTQLAVGMVARNRFDDGRFGSPSTYQAAIVCQQFNGVCPGTSGGPDMTTGPQNYLNNAIEVWTGRAGDFTLRSQCFFTPSASARQVIEEAYNSGTTTMPGVSGDPGCFSSSQRQYVLFNGIYPSFVLIRERTSGEAAVIGDIPRTGSSVTFYEHIDFIGTTFSAGGDVPFVGWDWNDRISSIRIPPGKTVTLYEAIDYGGASVTLTSDQPDLRNVPRPGGNWNDVVSSIRIR